MSSFEVIWLSAPDAKGKVNMKDPNHAGLHVTDGTTSLFYEWGGETKNWAKDKKGAWTWQGSQAWVGQVARHGTFSDDLKLVAGYGARFAGKITSFPSTNYPYNCRGAVDYMLARMALTADTVDDPNYLIFQKKESDKLAEFVKFLAS